MDILQTLQREFQLKPFQIENTVKLIDEGNTIPFIARYRKEMTGSLDDQLLRVLADRLIYLRGMEEKRQQVQRTITEQGNMTEEIFTKLENAVTMTEIEDIYRPFRPKRRTRATIAREKGLAPLADYIGKQEFTVPLSVYAEKFLDAEKGVETVEDAVSFAKDILAEEISDNGDFRKLLRQETYKKGILSVKAADETVKSVYEMYYDYAEPLKSFAPHRILAVNRGEKEGILSVKLAAPVEELQKKLEQRVIHKNSPVSDLLAEVIADAYKRLLAPSIERELRTELTEKAEESAMRVFAANLKQLLLQPPVKDRIVLALDPAFRTGCKIAVIDQTGKTLDTTVVYPTPPQNKKKEAKETLTSLIQKYHVEVIAIGNGTASRESEQFVAEMIQELDRPVYYVIVNEAGASVYSASKLGAEEFPEFDVALRSAVSIGRRLQDPLAELVKIDPKSIGVGQYQHDMNQKRLGEMLGGVVEDCVNSVGVDLNTASPSLLGYVAGISGTVAKNIQAYREQAGKFQSRKELKKVPKLGPKAFEQCAGFLRVPESEEVLDNTGVHPESYASAKEILKMCGYTLDDVRQHKVSRLAEKLGDLEKAAQKLAIGEPTLRDIIKELEKEGFDPREELPKPVLRSDVLSMEDLKEGMVLKGTVRNVIDFGVFVDIGVHQDGLVHISQIGEKFIKHPLEAVKVGDIVNVSVLGVDLEKKRISLTMKGVPQ